MKTTLRSFLHRGKKAAWLLPVLLLLLTVGAQAQTASRQAPSVQPTEFSVYAVENPEYVDLYFSCPEAGVLEVSDGEGNLLSMTEVSANRSPVVRIHGIPLHPYLIRHRGISGTVYEAVVTEAP